MKSLLPLFLTACNASLEGSPTDDDHFVLATYEVPPGYESRVEDVLNRAFWRGENIPLLGRALQGAPGTVVVAAPANAQDDVKAVIARLGQLDAAVAQPQNVRLSYWMVGGKKATAVDTSTLPPAISSQMAEVASTEVPMHYEVVFHESLLSLDGSRAQAKGANFMISQVVSVTPAGSILADIDIDTHSGVGTETRVQLAPGQVLVMGQTAGTGGVDPDAPAYDALFYVVRPDRVAAQ